MRESRPGDPFSNAHFRNNLFLGTDAPGPADLPLFQRHRRIPLTTTTATAPTRKQRRSTCGRRRAGRAARLRTGRRAVEAVRDAGRIRAATGQETHGIEVDYDIFENLRPPDPAKPHAVYHARDLNFRLKPGSKAVDAGVFLPNVNDGFTGKAPDLGAYELDPPVPVYGPRTKGAKAEE